MEKDLVIPLSEYVAFTEWREKHRYFNFNTNLNKWVRTFTSEETLPDEYLKKNAKTTKQLLTEFRNDKNYRN